MPERQTDTQTIRMRLPSRLDLLEILDHVALDLCRRLEFDGDTCSQVAMSIVEAGTNAIQHGNDQDASKPLDVDFTLFPDRLEIDVRDGGSGFDLASVNGDATAPERLLEPRGRGIFIMRACMDSVEFEFTGSGTTCHMVKRRPPKIEPS